jgi:hypothetical protein
MSIASPEPDHEVGQAAEQRDDSTSSNEPVTGDPESHRRHHAGTYGARSDSSRDRRDGEQDGTPEPHTEESIAASARLVV